MAIYEDGTDQDSSDATDTKTTEEVQDDVAGMLVPGNNVGMEYRDADDEFEINAKTGGGASYPGEFTPASRYTFQTTTGTIRDVVMYGRLFLPEKEISKFGWFPVEGKDGDIAFGIYSDTNGVPDSLLTSTGVQTKNMTDNTFNYVSLGNAWKPPKAGFYWTAWITDVAAEVHGTYRKINDKVSVSGTVSSGDKFFHPILTESRLTSNGLPSTASPTVSNFTMPFWGVFT